MNFIGQPKPSCIRSFLHVMAKVPMPLNREYALHMEKKNPTSVDIKKQGKFIRILSVLACALGRERFMVVGINSRQNQAFFHY